MNQALLIRLGGLGDLLVALPAIRLVRTALPKVRLRLVGRREYGAILQEAGLVDFVASADEARWAPLIARLPDFDKAPDIAPDDFIFGWFHIPGDVSGTVPVPSRQRPPAFFWADPRGETPLHRAFFMETGEFFRTRGHALPPFEECVRLPVSDDQRRRGRLFVGAGAARKRLAVVHPGSGSRRKCWPLDRFLAVVSWLAERGMAGVLITGEADGWLEPELRRTILPDGWTWRPNPRLSDLAGLLASADLYLGNDSGVTHLAAVCGARLVALFRDEFKSAWRPSGDVRMLSAPDIGDISTYSVLEAVGLRLGEYFM